MLILAMEYYGVPLVQGAILGKERVTLRPWLPSPRIRLEAPSAVEFPKLTKKFILTARAKRTSSTQMLRHEQSTIWVSSPASEIGSPRSHTR